MSNPYVVQGECFKMTTYCEFYRVYPNVGGAWAFPEDVRDGGILAYRMSNNKRYPGERSLMLIPNAYSESRCGYDSFEDMANFAYLEENYADRLIRVWYSENCGWAVWADEESDIENDSLAYDIDELVEGRCLDDDAVLRMECDAIDEAWESDFGWQLADFTRVCDALPLWGGDASVMTDSDDFGSTVRDILRDTCTWYPDCGFEYTTPVYSKIVLESLAVNVTERWLGDWASAVARENLGDMESTHDRLV